MTLCTAVSLPASNSESNNSANIGTAGVTNDFSGRSACLEMHLCSNKSEQYDDKMHLSQTCASGTYGDSSPA